MSTKRNRRVTGLALAAALLLAVGAGAVYSAPKTGQVVTVRVLRAKVMESPKYIGKVAGTVSRGEQLTFREARGLWYRVEGGVTGWIHKSSVIAKAVQLSSKPGGGVGASSSEVELAGRGFTPQVEQKYKQDNPNLDFAHIDAIENTEVDPTRLQPFVAEGGLEVAR